MINKEEQSIKNKINYGQGINLKTSEIRDMNQKGAPILFKNHNFAALETSHKVSCKYITPMRRIPALIMPRGIGRYYCSFNEIRSYTYREGLI